MPVHQYRCASEYDYVSIFAVLHIQSRTVGSQPFLSLAMGGHYLVHLIPESIGVVEVVEVAKLMHHDVVDDGLRGHHALPVKGQAAVRRT